MPTIIGCDLGKASASFVIAAVTPDGTLQVEKAAHIPHEGDPFGVFCQWYRENKAADCAP